MSKHLLLNLAIATMLGSSLQANATVWFVKANASGDGSSWQQAAGNIDDVIAKASAGDEIWIASGTYKPTNLIRSNKADSRAFTLKDGVSLYGGFAGSETSLSERAMGSKPYEFINETILSGDDDVEDVWTRNFQNGSDYQYAYDTENDIIPGTRHNANHVLYGGTDVLLNPTVIDGLTLTGGNAMEWKVKAAGGALYAIGNVRLNACKVIKNSAYFKVQSMTNSDTNGGGVYLDGSDVIGAAITNCYFESNYSHSSYGNGLGGAAWTRNVTIDGCEFVDNVALDNGGSLYAKGGTLKNSTFTGSYGSIGVAVYIEDASVEACKVFDCRGLQGGGVYAYGGTIKNSIIASCTADTKLYGDDQGGQGGGIYNRGALINNVAVYNNTAFVGGGVYMNTGTMTKSTVQNNTIRSTTAEVNVGYSANSSDTDVTLSIVDDKVDADNFINPTHFYGPATLTAELDEIKGADWNLSKSSVLKGTGFSMETTATGIRGLHSTRVKNESVYNIGGQKVRKATKGIFIIGNKKVVIR